MAGFDRVVEHRMSLEDKVAHAASALCGALGADAIEVRVLFGAGSSTRLVLAEAGAAEGDVMRLKRMKRPEPVK